jgi:RNA recognition motif-containing protein
VQCVILRDAEKTDAKGQAKSRGCAFVEFESHEDALVCLRQMNNNAALFGGKAARPIVEFAVENVRALQIQQKKRRAIEDMKQQRSMAEGMLLHPMHSVFQSCCMYGE